jgi:hypothetical protein
MIYEPMIWQSYSVEDKVSFLLENGCSQNAAEDYAHRDFASLPRKIREAIESLEDFDQ